MQKLHGWMMPSQQFFSYIMVRTNQNNNLNNICPKVSEEFDDINRVQCPLVIPPLFNSSTSLIATHFHGPLFQKLYSFYITYSLDLSSPLHTAKILSGPKGGDITRLHCLLFYCIQVFTIWSKNPQPGPLHIQPHRIPKTAP